MKAPTDNKALKPEAKTPEPYAHRTTPKKNNITTPGKCNRAANERPKRVIRAALLTATAS